jgi:hypothetical protein
MNGSIGAIERFVRGRSAPRLRVNLSPNRARRTVMKSTAAIDPPDEPCPDVAPAPPLVAPSSLIEPQREQRLIAVLREAARTRNPVKILARAAEAFYWASRPAPQASVLLARALADLAVTGRESYRKLRTIFSIEATVREVTTGRLAASGTAADPDDVAGAVTKALDRAYAVAWALRGPLAVRAATRAPLGWVAVSSEDDSAHRPVNVAPPPFEQFDIPVTTHGVTVQTRFFIASPGEAVGPAGPTSPRELPPDPVPHVPDGHRILLFLHGHSSSAEEALALIPHLHAAGLARGVKYAVVCFDLPNSGYAQPFDHTVVAPSSATSYPGGIFDHDPIRTPILDFTEDFVVAFVDALDAVTPVKNRIDGVIGGSLGGNLGLRLGRRVGSPWLDAGIVSWSPASVWDPLVQDEIKRIGPDHCRGLWDVSETEGSRAAYFDEVYDKPVFPVLVPQTQPELWYRDDWQPCKAFRIAESRVARQEIYNPSFRRWHWRLGGEQLIYSHKDRVEHDDDTTPWRFALNKVRHLLVAGQRDNYVGARIFDATRDLADFMASTPGRSLFLNDTGHSIHIERPRFLAGEIVGFLFRAGTELVPIDVSSFVSPLLLGACANDSAAVSAIATLLLSGASS